MSMFEWVYGEDMTVIHPHPHPLAMRVVTPTNPEILRVYGKVRVEDWDDRVSGYVLSEHLRRGGNKAVNQYVKRIEGGETNVPLSSHHSSIVRCHTMRSGDMILLHDDWLPELSDLG
jgi:hypothetical protein